MKVSEFKKLIREEVRRVLSEAKLDPNATYKVDITVSRSEYDPGTVEKVAGEPLAVAKAVKKMAYDDLKAAGYSKSEIGEYVMAYKLDQDTYYIITGEEDATVVGKPKSAKYGAFWSMSDESEEIFHQMEGDAVNAPQVQGMGGTVSSLGKVATKKQSSKKGIEVGDVVRSFTGRLGDLKVVRVYPDKKAVAAAVAKLPAQQAEKARRWFDDANNRFDEGPFVQIVSAKGTDKENYPKILATTVLSKV